MKATLVYGLSVLLAMCMFTSKKVLGQEREKTRVFVSPTVGFIPHGVNSIEGLSAGIIRPISQDYDAYLEMMGMTTFSTGIEDAFEFDDWHSSTYYGIEIGAMRYLSLERFDNDRLLQVSLGLMYRTGSEELLVNADSDGRTRRRTRTYQGDDFLLFTDKQRLNDIGLSLGSAYDFGWWETVESYAGGRLYLTPSGEHFFRFSFQVFYDI